MKTLARSKNVKISPAKLRLAAGLVRNMTILDAKDLLTNTNKKAARIVYDTLKSASFNAQNNHKAKESDLVIEEIRVDEAKKMKRYRPRARGMSSSIIHRSSHLTIIVSDKKNKTQKNDKKVIKKTKTSSKEKK